jgi:hypothetical protein
MVNNVTQGQFEQTLEMLAELRRMIVSRVDSLSNQLTDGVDKITRRQDIANGRLDKHEQRLLGLTTEMRNTEQVAVDIQEHGCHRLDEHEAKVEVLKDIGIVENKWKLTARNSVFLGGGILAGIFIQYFAQILHWISHLFLEMPK